MRKLSLVFVAAMLLMTGSSFANNPVNENPVKQLSTQIGELLDSEALPAEFVDLTAQVRFTLNKKGEIVVLSVDSDHQKLETFVKSRLNYKKVEVGEFKEGALYTVPVRFAGV
ncbi:hypothetical protein [Maribacter polysaccharolyticus]|uniref:hypothetical protein n=1 Tax=Maribacter polysaccharolyticus TaxID=3020831 RepID=UPI00237F8016|nr:hypothetical protein [Maribacter polysaccharolyticus]MDE3741874.1 hypothetical protein [Maribacter polysaccharolyticus]